VIRSYLSNIPRARERLEVIARALETCTVPPPDLARMIREVIREDLYRHKPDRRAPAKARTTRAKKDEARKLREKFPQTSQLEIAASVGMNQGRVSEAIHEGGQPARKGTLL
jgi:predicted nucleic acid-binding protein